MHRATRSCFVSRYSQILKSEPYHFHIAKSSPGTEASIQVRRTGIGTQFHAQPFSHLSYSPATENEYQRLRGLARQQYLRMGSCFSEVRGCTLLPHPNIPNPPTSLTSPSLPTTTVPRSLHCRPPRPSRRPIPAG